MGPRKLQSLTEASSEKSWCRRGRSLAVPAPDLLAGPLLKVPLGGYCPFSGSRTVVTEGGGVGGEVILLSYSHERTLVCGDHIPQVGLGSQWGALSEASVGQAGGGLKGSVFLETELEVNETPMARLPK